MLSVKEPFSGNLQEIIEIVITARLPRGGKRHKFFLYYSIAIYNVTAT